MLVKIKPLSTMSQIIFNYRNGDLDVLTPLGLEIMVSKPGKFYAVVFSVVGQYLVVYNNDFSLSNLPQIYSGIKLPICDYYRIGECTLSLYDSEMNHLERFLLDEVL
jgi:hypothetical protein